MVSKWSVKPSTHDSGPETGAPSGTSRDLAREMEEKIVRLESAVAPSTSTRGKWKAIHGLLWCEWYAHSKLLLFFLAAWLSCVWVLPLYANPAWILLFGALYSL